MDVVILLSYVGATGTAAWLLMRKAIRELEEAVQMSNGEDADQ